MRLGGTDAGGFARCVTTTAEGPGVYRHGGDHARTGDRRDYGDLYADSPGDAEVAAVAKPEELWRIGDKIRCCNWGGYTQGSDGDFSLFSWEAYKNFRARTPEFTDLAALEAGNAALGVRRAGSQAPADTRNGEYVSGNFFRTLGVQPWIGRLMTDADDQEGAPPVAVMSYRIWKEKYWL